MAESEAICDREQCRYIGPVQPENSKATRILASLSVTLFTCVFVLPILWSPLTAWLAYNRFTYRCPACRRGKLIPTGTVRGQALKNRAKQSARC